MAKGCAAENAIDSMRQAGVESGIISLGGNVQTLGLKPDGSRVSDMVFVTFGTGFGAGLILGSPGKEVIASKERFALNCLKP